jgi:hypothetical protein
MKVRGGLGDGMEKEKGDSKVKVTEEVNMEIS